MIADFEPFGGRRRPRRIVALRQTAAAIAGKASTASRRPSLPHRDWRSNPIKLWLLDAGQALACPSLLALPILNGSFDPETVDNGVTR